MNINGFTTEPTWYFTTQVKDVEALSPEEMQAEMASICEHAASGKLNEAQEHRCIKIFQSIIQMAEHHATAPELDSEEDWAVVDLGADNQLQNYKTGIQSLTKLSRTLEAFAKGSPELNSIAFKELPKPAEVNESVEKLRKELAKAKIETGNLQQQYKDELTAKQKRIEVLEKHSGQVHD